MKRKHLSVVLGALLVLAALGSVGCTTTVGVGVAVPINGGWGTYGGWSGGYGGVYVGGPVWP
jgi:hypothetical protein